MTKKKNFDYLSVFIALPQNVKSPSDNAQSPEKVQLGKLLFYDPILSGEKDVACATCHHPSNGYAEYRDLSIGSNGRGLGSKRVFNKPNKIPLVKRNAPTILNVAFNGINTTNQYTPESAPMFWDLRINSLESQALLPILTYEEMRGTHFSEDQILSEIIKRLKNIPKYVSLFKAAYGGSGDINAENIAKSIAAFERTLITPNTRFDRFLRGDADAISLAEKEGFRLFKKVGCGNCHNGPMFSDYQPHILGVPKNPELLEMDKGIKDTYAFRTASLRNLRFTAPYMHNGSFNSLKEVLEFYEDMADGKSRLEEVTKQQFDPLISELKLSVKEMEPIISFLNSLNDADYDKSIPTSVPSGLNIAGNIKP
ncbi:MAG: cytochrome-c peroxidase [Saprospiraceae bacterium]|nr:cytochrome-c peroxidase [Saprospiraceae bacterium]